MKFGIPFPALLMAVATAGSSAAKTAPAITPLQPNSAWQVDYGEAECRIIRQFGSADTASFVQISRDGPLSTFTLAVRAPALPDNANGRTTEIRFDGDAKWASEPATPVTIANGAHFFAFPQIRGDFWTGFEKRLATDSPLVLRVRMGTHEVAFDLRKMKAVKAALDKCEDDLMTKVGLDGPTLRNLREAPQPATDPQNWLGPGDFPIDVNQRNRSGGVLVWLDIDETGKLTDCRVLDAVGDEAFRKVSCDKLRQRGTFKPAISASGTPVKAYWTRRVIWLRSAPGIRAR